MSEDTFSDLTIIIPAINERDNIEQLTADIRAQVAVRAKILIADGGSTDDTTHLARSHHLSLISCDPGRAKQMNAGASAANTELLLFLHADTRLTQPNLLKNALHAYRAQRKIYAGILAGHFPIQFTKNEKSSVKNKLFWRYAEEKTAFNRPDTINGDQGLLISREDLSRLGGFDESLHFLEDQKISANIFQKGRWILLPGQLTTSARRFETEGTYRLYILMSIIMGLFKTDFDAFFERAPALYRQQNHSNTLLLTPFFQLIWSIKIKQLGLIKSFIAWYKVGQYIRGHSWQLFYFLDQLLRPLYQKKKYPLLWLHDHVIEKLVNNVVFNTITMVIAFLWFMVVLFPACWILERKRLCGVVAS
jgi:rSAM/selenodomain-associated transferase 2